MLDSSGVFGAAIAGGSASSSARTAPLGSGGGNSCSYERRRPEFGTLHRVVRENLNTFYAAAEQGFATPLPKFVRRELLSFLPCNSQRRLDAARAGNHVERSHASREQSFFLRRSDFVRRRRV